MKTARTLYSAGTLVLSAAMLGACVSGGPSGGPIDSPPAQTGVEGTWIDPTGGVSTLSGGVFQTVASDTSEKLSEGRYVLNGPDSVSITGTSLARQRRGQPSEVSFNCLKVSQNQLNCTSSTGAQFILTRRA